MANRTAQDAVERAITKWGRFNLVLDPQTADLIIAVRKGNKSGPVISHSPLDDRPVVYLPGVPDARVGQPQTPGRPPDLTQPFPGGSGNRGPQLGSQVISSDDTFEVYRGGGEYPLDTVPVWRYIAKGSLDGPQVAAVEQFRKAIEGVREAAPAETLNSERRLDHWSRADNCIGESGRAAKGCLKPGAGTTT